jgi:hypothetical protein
MKGLTHAAPGNVDGTRNGVMPENDFIQRVDQDEVRLHGLAFGSSSSNSSVVITSNLSRA